MQIWMDPHFLSLLDLTKGITKKATEQTIPRTKTGHTKESSSENQ